MLAFDPIDEARAHWETHGWGDAAAGMAVVTSVMRVQQLLLAQIDAALRPHGLTFARYEVLVLLTFSRTGELPLKVIGSRLMVHPTSVTNAIDRLVAAGYVRRRPNPDEENGATGPKGPATSKRLRPSSPNVSVGRPTATAPTGMTRR